MTHSDPQLSLWLVKMARIIPVIRENDAWRAWTVRMLRVRLLLHAIPVHGTSGRHHSRESEMMKHEVETLSPGFDSEMALRRGIEGMHDVSLTLSAYEVKLAVQIQINQYSMPKAGRA